MISLSNPPVLEYYVHGSIAPFVSRCVDIMVFGGRGRSYNARDVFRLVDHLRVTANLIVLDPD